MNEIINQIEDLHPDTPVNLIIAVLFTKIKSEFDKSVDLERIEKELIPFLVFDKDSIFIADKDEFIRTLKGLI